MLQGYAIIIKWFLRRCRLKLTALTWHIGKNPEFRQNISKANIFELLSWRFKIQVIGENAYLKLALYNKEQYIWSKILSSSMLPYNLCFLSFRFHLNIERKYFFLLTLLFSFFSVFFILFYWSTYLVTGLYKK